MKKVSIRLGTPDEVVEVCGLLTERAKWIEEKGYVQWNIPYPESLIKESILRNQLYVAHLGDEIVGTIELSDRDDQFWPDKNDAACYVHKLASKLGEKGIGTDLLAWAKIESISRDKLFLRLDCGKHNPHLQSFYLNRGFTAVGQISVILNSRTLPRGAQPQWTSILFECDLREGDQ